MKSKSEAGKFEFTTGVDNQPKEEGGPIPISVAGKAAWTADVFGGVKFNLALKDSGIIESTSTFNGLDAIHEHL
jgi:hypothetical protein